MKMKSKLKTMTLAVAIATASLSAHAVLERVGPISTAPSIGGFPVWYQDTSGLALEFCDPQNASEVSGGWCLLLPGDVPITPEVFPTRFFDEHFYFAANASATTATGGKALLTLAEESAFAVGPARAGDQITFARIRVVLNPVPVSGTYRIIHPYGEELIDAVAGGRIFLTEDVGIGAPGDFSLSLTGSDHNHRHPPLNHPLQVFKLNGANDLIDLRRDLIAVPINQVIEDIANSPPLTHHFKIQPSRRQYFAQ